MKRQMFITVGIPVYNVELYLEECLESILKQTEKDFEIVLVDDGSTDNSPIICDYYAKNYPSVIRVIHKEHNGSLLTRRVCLKEAKGEFIYLMDSDDKLIDTDAFKKVRKIIQQTNCDIVLFAITRNETTKEPLVNLPFNHMEVFVGRKREALYELFVSGDSMNSLCKFIFSRKLADFDADYSVYKNVICVTDAFQAIAIVSNANRIVAIKDVFYYYRRNHGSITKSFNINVFESYKTYSTRLEGYLHKWGMLDRSGIKNLLCKKRLTDCQGAVTRMQFAESICKNRKEYITYLQSIAEDSYFKENLSFSSYLNYKGQVLVFLLKWHLFDAVLLLVVIRKFVSRHVFIVNE